LTKKHFAPEETIVTEGDPVDSVYLIISGTADVRHVTIKDHALHIQSLATLGPGAAIGLNETGFYSLSGIRTATVVALTDMLTFRLSVPAFHGFALAHHNVSKVMRANATSFAMSNQAK
jgi:CRP-like cAMP-binding protein